MIQIPDPFTFGPTPLVTEKQRGTLDAVIDKLQESLVHAITTNVPAGADPLIDRGYKLNELRICDFGSSIYVEPKQEVSRFRLWVRRVMVRMHIRSMPLRNYAAIECEDRDTRRLIDGLNIFKGGLTLQ